MFAKLCAMRNKKGFTLAELLIVVAIVGVLVAIAIPIFSASLTDAENAVQDANYRAAKAVAAVKVLQDLDGSTEVPTEGYWYKYEIDETTRDVKLTKLSAAPTEGDKPTSNVAGNIHISASDITE